jgi:ABC-type nickel/cobalt efflux system permease component RcnA
MDQVKAMSAVRIASKHCDSLARSSTMADHNHDWKETAAHAVHHVMHTETGKHAASYVATTLSGLAPPAAAIAVATVAAPSSWWGRRFIACGVFLTTRADLGA